MLQEERHAKILEIVNQRDFVSVKDLAAYCKVSLDCIRKDLTILENKKLLQRVHGGAHGVRLNIRAYHVKDREYLHTEEKENIAKKASKFIQEGDFVYLDISTINLLIVKYLTESEKKVTIATNMIAIMEHLREQHTVSCLFIGGSFNEGHDGFTGVQTQETIGMYRFDKCFMGCVGVDIENNFVMTYDPDDAHVKKAVLTHSKETFLLAEHEKFHQDGQSIYTKLDAFQTIVTDLPSYIQDNLRTSKIHIY